MAQILVRNLKPETVERLKSQARQNNRSLEAEVRALLESTAEPKYSPEYQKFQKAISSGKPRNAAFLEYVTAIQARGRPQSTDSTEIIREAREGRGRYAE